MFSELNKFDTVSTGLIDVLQQYNIRKTAESMMRSIINKRSEVSAVDPDFYAERFLQFIADNST